MPSAHQPGREPADPAIVALADAVAGDGDVDERCARILDVFRHRWGFVNTDDPPPDRAAAVDPLRAVAAEIVDTWRDTRHPALATVVRHLERALDRRRSQCL